VSSVQVLLSAGPTGPSRQPDAPLRGLDAEAVEMPWRLCDGGGRLRSRTTGSWADRRGEWARSL